MKKLKQSKLSYIVLTIAAFILLPLILASFVIQQTDPWTSSQLLAPADLASVINDPKSEQPFVFCVGPGAVIKGSYAIGPAVEKTNLDKLKNRLDSLQRDADIVIYCGCCPFNKCPNIRPAFSLLNNMGFKNHKLLNLPQNIKADWIDHGYPVRELH
jgi:hypothetical protein